MYKEKIFLNVKCVIKHQRLFLNKKINKMEKNIFLNKSKQKILINIIKNKFNYFLINIYSKHLGRHYCFYYLSFKVHGAREKN